MRSRFLVFDVIFSSLIMCAYSLVWHSLSFTQLQPWGQKLAALESTLKMHVSVLFTTEIEFYIASLFFRQEAKRENTR